ncbi:ATP-binding protein [Streptomyces sp. NPDC002088]|uniref:ATP-binding protein n=1 Tax=Streptomyces sp. NPDC002088 TaxID=3154665 RepID=UPI00332B1496
MRAKHPTGPATEPARGPDYSHGPSGTTGPGEGESCSPADVRSAVRRVVDRQCRAAGSPCDETALADALLVASELTTNAILHGGGVTGFDVGVEGRGVRVSVCDRSERLPVVTPSAGVRGRCRTGGRGWPIVCRLSWDVRVSELPRGGKRITAVVPVF